MPIIVFGNYSIFSEHKTDTSFFVQKPYLRTNFLKIIIEEDIDLKNQYKIKNLPDLISIREAASKNYVNNCFENDIDFNDFKLEIIKLVTVNYQPAVNEHLTPKVYVDNAIDEPTLVRNKQDKKFNNHKLTNINSVTLKAQAVQAVIDNQVITKAYIDQFHPKDERSRRQLGRNFYDESSKLVQNNQDIDFNDNKIVNLGSNIINRNPYSDNEFANKNMLMIQDAVVIF